MNYQDLLLAKRQLQITLSVRPSDCPIAPRSTYFIPNQNNTRNCFNVIGWQQISAACLCFMTWLFNNEYLPIAFGYLPSNWLSDTYFQNGYCIPTCQLVIGYLPVNWYWIWDTYLPTEYWMPTYQLDIGYLPANCWIFNTYLPKA